MKKLERKLVTAPEAHDIWNISRPTLYRLEKLGEIKAIKLGRRTLFDVGSIEALLARAPQSIAEGRANPLHVRGRAA